MELDTGIAAVLGGVLGLLVGSFLNVVIHRLPKMMERQWAADCAAMVPEAAAGAATGPASPATATSTSTAAPATADPPRFNLMTPASRCPQCGHAIRWWENIPVFSYMALRGRCAGCRTRISVRYPLVELATGAAFAWCLGRWGVTPAGAVWCGFAAALIALALIDWDTTLLPDDITLPLLWGGLLAAALQWNAIGLADAVWGAAAGYVSLWAVYWAFKLATGKEGMGHGDFKLFAALGAWFGWSALIPIILMASTIGAVIGIAMKFRSALREGGYIPFGPFLAGAGLTAMLFGPNAILRAIGL